MRPNEDIPRNSAYRCRYHPCRSTQSGHPPRTYRRSPPHSGSGASPHWRDHRASLDSLYRFKSHRLSVCVTPPLISTLLRAVLAPAAPFDLHSVTSVSMTLPKREVVSFLRWEIKGQNAG